MATRIEHVQLDLLLENVDVYTAVEKAVALGAERSKAIAPVLTGALKASIDHDVEETEAGPVGRWGTPLDYGKYVELGHHTQSGTWVPPQPFLRPAAASL